MRALETVQRFQSIFAIRSHTECATSGAERALRHRDRKLLDKSHISNMKQGIDEDCSTLITHTAPGRQVARSANANALGASEALNGMSLWRKFWILGTNINLKVC